MKCKTVLSLLTVLTVDAYQQGWSPRGGDEQFAKKVAGMRERIVEPLPAKPPQESSKPNQVAYVTTANDPVKQSVVKTSTVVTTPDSPSPPSTTTTATRHKEAFAKKVEEMRQRTQQRTVESAARVQAMKLDDEQSILKQPASSKPAFFMGGGI